jgi:hypothetical protein
LFLCCVVFCPVPFPSFPLSCLFSVLFCPIYMLQFPLHRGKKY